MYFNVTVNVFSKLIKVHLLVSEPYMTEPDFGFGNIQMAWFRERRTWLSQCRTKKA